MVRSSKIDRWSGKTCIRERTLQDCALLRSAFGIALPNHYPGCYAAIAFQT
ncbi:hypothetical protein [Microcystis aeruginosa]|nr:hypothetical protein [Microcystis aeruginosa]